jgi:hypothetical protein
MPLLRSKRFSTLAPQATAPLATAGVVEEPADATSRPKKRIGPVTAFKAKAVSTLISIVI